MGKAGSLIDFPGTEGYVPPDGMGTPALDVFALGRSLYEAWTGLDRFQFPSLPARIIDSEDWQTHGWQLNQIVAQACDKRPSHRIPSARTFRDQLKVARHGRKRFSRRQMIGGTVGIVATGVCSYVYKHLPPYRAIWRRLPPKRFGYEHFYPSDLSLDIKRRMLYSIYGDTRSIVVQSVALKDFRHSEHSFPPTAHGLKDLIFRPDLDELWSVEPVTGKIYRFDVNSQTLKTFEQSYLDSLSFTGSMYLDGNTDRIGQFAGYGDFACHNQRREFNIASKSWNAVVEASEAIPYPRGKSLCSFAGSRGKKWHFFGGNGNPSGKQSERFSELRSYNGNYYPLNDLWTIDFQTNRWQISLKPQKYMPVALKSAIWHEQSNSVLFLCGSDSTHTQEAHLDVFSIDSTDMPVTIKNSGDRIDMFTYWHLMVDVETNHLIVFADEGVFDVELRRT